MKKFTLMPILVLLVSIQVFSQARTSHWGSEMGSLIPDIPHDVPNTPTVFDLPVPQNPLSTLKPSPENIERNAAEAHSRRANDIVDPNHIVQPIRWSPPLSSVELNTFMNCSNYERFGLTPDMSRETILSRHFDCCFSGNNDGRHTSDYKISSIEDNTFLAVFLFTGVLVLVGVITYFVIRKDI